MTELQGSDCSLLQNGYFQNRFRCITIPQDCLILTSTMLRFFEYATKLGCLSFKIDFWKISNHYFVSDKGYWCAKIHKPTID